MIAATDGLVVWVTERVTTGGVWALLAVMLIENLFPPIPSEAVLPLAGFLIEGGSMSFAPALLAATAGSVIGAVLLYAIGRWGGRPVLLRWGGVLRLDEAQLDRADEWFDTHGPKLVFWCRMVPLARSVISVPAGAAEMPLGRFLTLTALGSLIWNCALIGAGYIVGENWDSVTRVIGTYTNIALVALAIGAVAVVVLWRRNVRRRKVNAER
jgi:membrane protein DedA with SNARE-associated domain